MKKLLGLLLFLLVFVSGCGSEKAQISLRIYNWQEYIDEGGSYAYLDQDQDGEADDIDGDGEIDEFETKEEVEAAIRDAKLNISNPNIVVEEWDAVIDAWKTWYKEQYNVDVKVVYDTFETNEVMMNNLKTGKTTYDLVCPSEYTIQKMISQNMLEEYDYDLKDPSGNLILSNYENVSLYLRNLFDDHELTKYAIPYMWGTMGFIYNPDVLSEISDDYETDINSWSILWNKDYRQSASVKDSMRDTYVVGVMYCFREQLMQLKEQYENNEISSETYNYELSAIMNGNSQEILDRVEKALIEMKNNAYGFEVDSGKNDIVTGKIAINFAWSGDAVYSMDEAESEDVYLNYVVPEEGSNIWFDGWVMPKGANKQLAQSFVNYLCEPEVAVQNMNYIGYTSAVAGDEIIDMINDWYGSDEGYEVDLTYFFTGNVSDDYLDEDGLVKVTVAERGRQFDAQYPEYETIIRCGIMEDFGENNDRLIAMWENVKMGDIPITLTFVLIALIALMIIGYSVIRFKKLQIRKKRRNKAKMA